MYQDTYKEGNKMEKIEFINLTSHDINIVTKEGELLRTIKSSKEVRCECYDQIITHINEGGMLIPITRKNFRLAEKLPEPKRGIFYIVSKIVAETAKNRLDLLIPGETIKKDGIICGCTSLCKL